MQVKNKFIVCTFKVTCFVLLNILFGFALSNSCLFRNYNPVSLSNLTIPKTNSLLWYKKSFYYNGLVLVSQFDQNMVLDLRYATTNNFTRKQIYDKNICLLQENTLKKLIAANKEFNSLGYRIKIWDAFRPQHIQLHLWNLVKDRRFIASPYVHWSRHNRGAAVDITLVDKNNKELEMPTGFDCFSSKAYRDSLDVSAVAKKNSDLLCSVMVKHGFKPIETEWWHFDDSDADTYPLIDINLNDLP